MASESQVSYAKELIQKENECPKIFVELSELTDAEFIGQVVDVNSDFYAKFDVLKFLLTHPSLTKIILRFASSNVENKKLLKTSLHYIFSSCIDRLKSIDKDRPDLVLKLSNYNDADERRLYEMWVHEALDSDICDMLSIVMFSHDLLHHFKIAAIMRPDLLLELKKELKDKDENNAALMDKLLRLVEKWFKVDAHKLFLALKSAENFESNEDANYKKIKMESNYIMTGEYQDMEKQEIGLSLLQNFINPTDRMIYIRKIKKRAQEVVDDKHSLIGRIIEAVFDRLYEKETTKTNKKLEKGTILIEDFTKWYKNNPAVSLQKIMAFAKELSSLQSAEDNELNDMLRGFGPMLNQLHNFTGSGAGGGGITSVISMLSGLIPNLDAASLLASIQPPDLD